jgi:hypothetical protein
MMMVLFSALVASGFGAVGNHRLKIHSSLIIDFQAFRSLNKYNRQPQMSEYTEVEQPFLQQLQSLGWQIIDQGQGIPQCRPDCLYGYAIAYRSAW